MSGLPSHGWKKPVRMPFRHSHRDAAGLGPRDDGGGSRRRRLRHPRFGLAEPTYTLVGTRPTGSTTTHTAVTMKTDDLTFPAQVQDFAQQGFAPVSLLQDYYTLPDGGLGADTLIVER
jgi:hypothetical protein